MKIYKFPIFFIAILSLSLSSCTQPEGYIGDWFGSWYLEEMLIDGELDREYADNKEENIFQIMISFQGKIFNIGYLNGNSIYGSWSYAGEILTLSTYYSPDEYIPHFNPFPEGMHFPADIQKLEITVTKINNRVMQWQYIDENGDLITYNFRKYP